MTDPISLPKLPVNLSDTVVDAPAQLQRKLNARKGTSNGSANDPELVAACRQMESLFVYHLFKEMRATIHQAGFISGGNAGGRVGCVLGFLSRSFLSKVMFTFSFGPNLNSCHF